MTPMQQDQQNQPKPAPPPGAKPATNPRVSGAVLVGVGLALEGINAATLANSNTYYPKLMIIGGACIPLGIWTLATGISYDKNNPVKPPGWWTAGAVVFTILGIVAGIGASVFLSG